MLEITFGKIESGCAETTFDFGTEPPLKLRVSYFTELFGDLAELALCMVRGEPSGMTAFTDEYDHYDLSFQRQPDGRCLLQLEGSQPWLQHPGATKTHTTSERQIENVDSWRFGFQLWSELTRIKALPGVLHWMLDEAPGLREEQFNQERNAKIDELEKALMEDHRA